MWIPTAGKVAVDVETDLSKQSTYIFDMVLDNVAKK